MKILFDYWEKKVSSLSSLSLPKHSNLSLPKHSNPNKSLLTNPPHEALLVKLYLGSCTREILCASRNSSLSKIATINTSAKGFVQVCSLSENDFHFYTFLHSNLTNPISCGGAGGSGRRADDTNRQMTKDTTRTFEKDHSSQYTKPEPTKPRERISKRRISYKRKY